MTTDNPCAFEGKKDGLRQTQDGIWKLTITVHPNDMPAWLLAAPMGQRLGATALKAIDEDSAADAPSPAVDGGVEPFPSEAPPPLSPGEKAKRHFEACCNDPEFRFWAADTFNDVLAPALPFRGRLKRHLGIESANEIVDNPEPWNRLWESYRAWQRGVRA